ncbi:MAG: ribonuclease HI [bacterium]
MNKIIIFSDGSSRGNPGPGGFASVICFGENDLTNVIELGGSEKNTTNNRMELTGAVEAFEELKKRKINGSVILYSDSSYVIKGISSWIKGWEANDWRTKDKKDVLNKDLWQRLTQVSSGFDVSWKVISGHVGIPGNERCDEIATSYATGETPVLFDGPMSEYKIPILDLSADQSKVEDKKSKSGKSGKAYSYISLVDGEIKIHKTWSECEARVKGKSNVRFKKSMSKIDEEKIVEDFTKRR